MKVFNIFSKGVPGTGKTSLANHIANAFDAETAPINLMSIKSISDGQAVLKTWMDWKTDKPKFLICDGADEGVETTTQRIITPIMDMSRVVVILTSDADGPTLPFHKRFNDRISAHIPFTMNDQLREEIMSREIQNLEKFDVKCSWASRTMILGIAQDFRKPNCNQSTLSLSLSIKQRWS